MISGQGLKWQRQSVEASLPCTNTVRRILQGVTVGTIMQRIRNFFRRGPQPEEEPEQPVCKPRRRINLFCVRAEDEDDEEDYRRTAPWLVQDEAPLDYPPGFDALSPRSRQMKMLYESAQEENGYMTSEEEMRKVFDSFDRNGKPTGSTGASLTVILSR